MIGLIIGVVVAFNVGFVASAFLSACGNRDSFDVWECTNREGATYYLVDPEEVAAALAIDGMLAVRRLRVLS